MVTLDMVAAEQDPEYNSQFVNCKSFDAHTILITFVAKESEEIVVLYSARVYKWNKFTIKQERVLVVTNLNVYTFHKKSK